MTQAALPHKSAFSHLPFALSALAAALAGAICGPALPGPALMVAGAFGLAVLVWICLYFGYAQQRRPALAGPYFLILWACAAAAALTAGEWRDWVERDAALRDAGQRGVAEGRAQARGGGGLLGRMAGADAAAAKTLVEAYLKDLSAANRAYVDELAGTGYLSAVSGETLTRQDGVDTAPARVARAREISARYAEQDLARLAKLSTALAALPARTEQQQMIAEDLKGELADLKEARIAYWDALSAEADEIERLAEILIRTKGAWTPDLVMRQVLFETDADHLAYEVHNQRYREHQAEADRRRREAARAAGAVLEMAERWGGEPGAAG